MGALSRVSAPIQSVLQLPRGPTQVRPLGTPPQVRPLGQYEDALLFDDSCFIAPSCPDLFSASPAASLAAVPFGSPPHTLGACARRKHSRPGRLRAENLGGKTWGARLINSASETGGPEASHRATARSQSIRRSYNAPWFVRRLFQLRALDRVPRARAQPRFAREIECCAASSPSRSPQRRLGLRGLPC